MQDIQHFSMPGNVVTLRLCGLLALLVGAALFSSVYGASVIEAQKFASVSLVSGLSPTISPHLAIALLGLLLIADGIAWRVALIS